MYKSQHIKMYSPKRTLANLEFIQQHIFTPVEMYQMRTKMIFSFCPVSYTHLDVYKRQHYTQFMVFDLDGDGKAEVVMKTSDGTKMCIRYRL